MRNYKVLIFLAISLFTLAACEANPAELPAEDATATTSSELSEVEFFTVTRNLDWEMVIRTIDGVEVVLVPPGCFLMGTTEEQIEIDQAQCNLDFAGCFNILLDDESPQHEICFEEPYWLDRSEVISESSSSSSPLDPAFPHVFVNWLDAAKACEARNGRLPTESEWEYAARGPDSWRYPWGNEFAGNLANFCDSSCERDWSSDIYTDGFPVIAPVGSIPLGASWVGALDMSGNVSEWTNSVFLPYPYDPEDGREVDINADSASPRILRGGSFFTIPTFLRSSVRFPVELNFLNENVGFRCVLPFDQ